MEKQQPKNKFKEGRISLAIFESFKDKDGDEDFYSLQKSKFVNNEWMNETIFLRKDQLQEVQKVIEQALAAGA